MNNKPSFSFFGAAHLDRIGRFDRPPMPGKSTPGRITARPGGAAFNTASLLAGFGVEVKLGSVAGPFSVPTLEETAEARGVRLSLQRHKREAGYTAFLDGAGEVLFALADMAPYDDFVPPKRCMSDWVVVDANLPESAIRRLTEFGRKRAGLAVSAAKAERLRGVLSRFDVLFCNAGEVTALLGGPADTATLHAQGVAGLVISDGARPVRVWDKKRMHELEVEPVTIVDATGAGDALAAATMAGLARGMDLTDAVQRGIRAAALVLAVEGPYRADIGELIGTA